MSAHKDSAAQQLLSCILTTTDLLHDRVGIPGIYLFLVMCANYNNNNNNNNNN